MRFNLNAIAAVWLVCASVGFSVHAQDTENESAQLRAEFLEQVSLGKFDSYATLALPKHIDSATQTALDNSPADNPMTDAGATLGRVLFYDRSLSQNDTISCASCHLQENAFADPRQFSTGFEDGTTTRNAMGLGYLRFTKVSGSDPGFFWDERASTLEDQVLIPIQDKLEMGMSLDDLEQKLQQRSWYPALFTSEFGSGEVTRERIAKAIAQFMRSIASFDSKFDRAANASGESDYSKDFEEFTDQENLGKSLFMNGSDGIAENGCAHCHVPPIFSMPKSFNNGLDLLYKDQGLGAIDLPSNDPFTPNNDGKFKAPSLRNIELTAPYMHDGRFTTLEQVVEHYSSGVHPHPNLGFVRKESVGEVGDESNAKTSGFQLTAKQKSALVAFLKTLTDKQVIVDQKYSDPFERSTD